MGKNSGGGIETSTTNFHNRTLDELSSNAGGCTSDILGSNESLNSVSSSIQQARANSLTKARLMLHQQQHNRAKAGIISSSTTGGNTTSTNASVAGTRSNVSEKSYSSLSTDRRTIEQDNDYYGIGKMHALKIYYLFSFWGRKPRSNLAQVVVRDLITLKYNICFCFNIKKLCKIRIYKNS